MRIYNRNYEAIIRARENRITKMRALACHSGNGVRTTCATDKQIKSNGITSKSDNLLQQILGHLKQSVSTTGEQFAANQSKSYDYGIAEVAVQRIGKHMDKFLMEGEDSLYGTDEKSREMLNQEVAAFVDDYNIAVKKLISTGSITDQMYVRNLKKQFTDREADFKEIGMKVNANGTLDFDRKILKETETDAIWNVFGAKKGIAAKLMDIAADMETGIRKQADALKKAGYTTSPNYNRYGSDASDYGIIGNRYSTKV